MTTESPTKRLLTVHEACGALALSRAKIYDLLLRGELDSISIGRARRIPLEAIDDFIQHRRDAAAAEV